MNRWCESCARKNLCYVVDDRPKCFVPITNTASGTPYLVGISSISRDNHEIAKDEPQTDRRMAIGKRSDATADKYNLYGKTTTDEPQTEVVMPYERMRGLYTGYRKTENCSERPNNSTCSKMEQVATDTNVGHKDEPQTDTEIAKAIVHKMIDDAVIAEDAYPDLRQKMHDAVDEYEPQTERSE